MSFGIRLGLIICAIGFATILAPLVFPRSAFGELGHGDGMGLIGLIMIAAVLVAAGVLTMIVAAVINRRTTTLVTESRADSGEEIK